MTDVYVWLLCLWKALIQRRKVSENKDECGVLNVPTTRVAYVKVTPAISNWIQPVAIGSRSKPFRDLDRTERDRIGSRSSCQCGQAYRVITSGI